MHRCKYCKATDARHYLGGGIWTCFECLLKHLR
jgi:ribosomal protein L37AE/L43A